MSNLTNCFALTCSLKRNIQYCIVRQLRGGITIPLKEFARKPKVKLPPETNEGLFKNNPGVNRRLKMFMTDGELDKNISDIDIDDLEPDIMNYGKAYKQHKQEMRNIKEKKHLHNVTRRTYKEPKSPNMLTYGEKVQIRYLHKENPDLWTMDKLANNFPASPQIIQKILKTDWTPRCKTQLLNHDKIVEENWKLFRKNKLKFEDEDLKKHISKFTNRHSKIYTETEIENLIKKSPMRPEAAEFGKIIESYKQIKNEPDENLQISDGTQITTTNAPKMKTYSEFISNSAKSITLDKYREILSEQKHHTELDELILKKENSPQTVPTKNPVSPKPVDNRDEDIYNYAPNTQMVSTKHSSLSFLNDDIQLRIEIPKKLWKRGMTYKMRDCFYDDNGSFMYRVPGLVL